MAYGLKLLKRSEHLNGAFDWIQVWCYVTCTKLVLVNLGYMYVYTYIFYRDILKNSYTLLPMGLKY